MSGGVTFHADAAGMHALEAEVDKHFSVLAEEVVTVARQRAPRKTGFLGNSIHKEKIGGRWCVVADAPYSLAVHEGTRPHLIAPRNASVLRFPTKAGTIVYTPNPVQHPGTKAQPFLTDALRAVIH